MPRHPPTNAFGKNERARSSLTEKRLILQAWQRRTETDRRGKKLGIIRPNFCHRKINEIYAEKIEAKMQWRSEHQ